ncbi:DNA glycosylase [Epithele typhae]|uniref:DNA glycosylase n=1 Tax=Epithele typhae TaxID=378194 RepID=UPI002008A653|nr:DNA glycosylase [Epithele typhae]KAH9945908.1 DNA glycosylase [Epithele typhae]
MVFPTPAGFHALPLPLAQLSLAAVLKCESSSHLGGPSHEYRLCLRDRVVCLRQSPDALFYRSVFPRSTPGDNECRDAETLAWIRDYFQLDVDLVELYQQWGSLDPVFLRLKDRFEGIRMLRQDPFENLISFICSSNNNIARITKMVKSLCLAYSPPLLSLPPPDDSGGAEEAFYPFPPPSALAAPEVSSKLRALGFGYRADFLQKTAAMLVESHGVSFDATTQMEPSEVWLRTLRQFSTADARIELLKFMGVGRKVADCVLLMSLDKREVIPVDTHVYQIAVKHYGLRVYDEVCGKLAAVWGSHAGWAHSVLFTADLKSFASYGISTSSTPPTPSLTPDRISDESDTSPGLLTPHSALSNKRKRGPSKKASAIKITEEVLVQLDVSRVTSSVEDETSLIDRVKRRKRTNVSSVRSSGTT